MVRTTFLKSFQDYYKGPLLSLWITGGGFSLLDMLKRPGCSKILNNVIIPYSENQIIKLLDKHWLWNKEDHIKSCTPEAVDLYRRCLELESGPGGCYVAVSAALTTNRYRKGKNHAFIAFKNDHDEEQLWELNLMKPLESLFQSNDAERTCGVLRMAEDEMVALSAMSLLLDDPSVSVLIQSDMKNAFDDRKRLISQFYQESEESFVRIK